MSEPLKPCGNKYCHGEKPFVSYSRKHGYRVLCPCGVRGQSVSAYEIGEDAAKAQAIAAWNRRDSGTGRKGGV